VTKLLLDTTFLIDVERGADLADVIANDDDVAIAAITIAELRFGVLVADGRRRRARASYVEELIDAIPIISYDLRVAEAHAQLLVAVRQQGRPRGAHELIIAATARSTGRVVLTADASAFADLPDVDVRSD
jgi:predicted nucleic acid-binding protein